MKNLIDWMRKARSGMRVYLQYEDAPRFDFRCEAEKHKQLKYLKKNK